MKKFLLSAVVCFLPVAAIALVYRPVPDEKDPGDRSVVTQVLAGSAAEKAGVKVGDVLLSINGEAIMSGRDVMAKASASGSAATLTVRRAGKTETLSATLPAPGAKGPRLGIRYASTDMGLSTEMVGPDSLSASASVLPRLTVIRVTIMNGSDHALHLSPEIVSVADGNQNMLKRLDNADATAILQGDRPAPAPVAAPVAPAAPPPGNSTAQVLTSFLFGRIGLGGQTAQLASTLVGSAAEAAKRTPVAVAPAAPPPPVITRSMVDQEAFPVEDLEPGFVCDGLIFFSETKASPLTVMIHLNGHKIVFRFEEPPAPPAAAH